MTRIEWTIAGLILAALASCAPMTPEQRAALDEQQRQYAGECQKRGGLFISGSCISRSGGP